MKTDKHFIDRIYSDYREQVSGFVFDEKVVAVFDDMIRRSVPGYSAVIAMTSVFADRYARAGTHCYDLGCSLGASTLAMRKGIGKKGAKIIAVDNSPEMVKRCREIVSADISPVEVEVTAGDILEVRFENSSMAVLNYTLQFIAPKQRDGFIKKIYDALVPGGMLLLSEKVTFDDAGELEFLNDLHLDFKRMNGYSEMEISAKRKSLENVLVPETLGAHTARLKDAGFSRVNTWFQCINFVSIAAVK